MLKPEIPSLWQPATPTKLPASWPRTTPSPLPVLMTFFASPPSLPRLSKFPIPSPLINFSGSPSLARSNLFPISKCWDVQDWHSAQGTCFQRKDQRLCPPWLSDCPWRRQESLISFYQVPTQLSCFLRRRNRIGCWRRSLFLSVGLSQRASLKPDLFFYPLERSCLVWVERKHPQREEEAEWKSRTDLELGILSRWPIPCCWRFSAPSYCLLCLFRRGENLFPRFFLFFSFLFFSFLLMLKPRLPSNYPYLLPLLLSHPPKPGQIHRLGLPPSQSELGGMGSLLPLCCERFPGHSHLHLEHWEAQLKDPNQVSPRGQRQWGPLPGREHCPFCWAGWHC